MRRTLIAGLAGGVTMNVVMVLTFRTIGFGWDAKGFLVTLAMQSPKVVAVWTTLAPLPLVVANPLPIAVGLVLFGLAHAYIYRRLAAGWPAGAVPRGTRFAGLVFVLSFLFWEFFTPFNLFGEPLPLIAVELSFWAMIALAEGLVIAAVFERGAAAPSVPSVAGRDQFDSTGRWRGPSATS